MTYQETAAIPQTELLLLLGLCSTGDVKPGQTFLINGAGNGVVAFAIRQPLDLSIAGIVLKKRKMDAL